MQECLIVTPDGSAADMLREALARGGSRIRNHVCTPDQWAEQDLPRAPDLVVIHWPGAGEARHRLLRAALERWQPAPLVAVSAPRRAAGARARLVAAGACELLDEPLVAETTQERLRDMLTLRRQSRILARLESRLGARRAQAWSQVLELEQEMLLRLSRLVAHNDSVTHLHQRRTARLSGSIARALGVDPQLAGDIQSAAYLHDVGKIGIPRAVLCKLGRYNDRDRHIMSRHPLIGYEILQGCESPVLQLGAQIAAAHHERFDGSGYPYGSAGTEIPLPARIVAVADVYDSLTHQRRYNRTRAPSVALAQIEQQTTHGQFDPQCTRALRSVVQQSAG